MLHKSNITLLDFDGVIYTNSVGHSLISHRISQYVRKTIKTKDQEIVSKLNTYLYKTFGHTVIGLNKLGYKVNIHDFNDYVYSDLPYDEICIQSDIKVSPNTLIFSNAPQEYIYKITKKRLPNVRDILPYYCDSFFLKPEKKIYTQISQAFNMYDITFIDDSFMNLKPILDNPQWKPILFNPEFNNTYTIGHITFTNEYASYQ